MPGKPIGTSFTTVLGFVDHEPLHFCNAAPFDKLACTSKGVQAMSELLCSSTAERAGDIAQQRVCGAGNITLQPSASIQLVSRQSSGSGLTPLLRLAASAAASVVQLASQLSVANAFSAASFGSASVPFDASK